MVEIKLDADTLRVFAMFEGLTRASLKDVIDEEERIVFVVDEGQVGRAIGKGAINLKRLRENMGRSALGMAGSVGDLLRHPGLNHRVEVVGGVDADASGQLLQAFFREKR